ncbi:protein MOS2 [Rhodamnia argentea]|uniref:Protein MOS2 n=1 Tax=Rhodamnia argentea TaxID=178133 RepID=A0A8B8MVK6_9MYRT|nr:protein MOS2 [Rhodamnia argentea]XP_048132806.1 protein MOS2 [Rhodamnia argentea]
MKLSFNASKKPPKPAAKPLSTTFGLADDGEAPSSSAREQITQFDSSDAPADDASRRVIPPKPNEWRPTKKMKNLDLPLQPDPASESSSDLSRFQPQSRSLDDEANASAVSYGLTVRQRENGGGDELLGDDGEVKPEALGKSRVDDSRLKLREEMAKLGNDPGYDDMPVEEFAAAYLRGYGWQEGKGVGKNAKEDVPPRQVEKKRGRERFGLGFEPLEPVREEKAKGRDSRGGEGKLRVGKEVRIVGGSREDLFGLKGKIVEVVGSESVILNLSRREEEVKVRITDLTELGSAEEEKFLRKMKELRIKNDSTGSRRKSGNEVKRDVRNGGDKRGDSGKAGWLMSHIRVRVISKDLKGGRLYLKKGRVVDVVGPNVCDILMDESKELIQGVDQEYLETALPKRGGSVFVLSGRYKGVHGSLVDRDSDRDTGVVRDADSQELFNVRLEQIAEYVGDPSLMGY